jgi:hypothetical protein
MLKVHYTDCRYAGCCGALYSYPLFQFVPKPKSENFEVVIENEDSGKTADFEVNLNDCLGNNLIQLLEQATMEDLRMLADILGVTYQV